VIHPSRFLKRKGVHVIKIFVMRVMPKVTNKLTFIEWMEKFYWKNCFKSWIFLPKAQVIKALKLSDFYFITDFQNFIFLRSWAKRSVSSRNVKWTGVMAKTDTALTLLWIHVTRVKNSTQLRGMEIHEIDLAF
jgi:hypothetical protein